MDRGELIFEKGTRVDLDVGYWEFNCDVYAYDCLCADIFTAFDGAPEPIPCMLIPDELNDMLLCRQ